ncbi:MAG: DUF4097 family beta strand repeat-containing protein [Gammaproteobacteria bacterium]
MKLKLYLPAFLLLTFAALPAFAGTPINKTVAAEPDGDVRISNVAGSVKITTWKRKQVHIGGTLGIGVKRLAVKKTSGGVNVRVVYPNHGNSEGSHLVIQIPAASHLRVNTVSADISAAGLTGPLELDSVSGDINLQSQSADISSRSVSGDVHIDGSAPKARVSAHSISGEVRAKNVGGELRAESVSGGIRIDATNMISRAKLDTTSGDIEFTAALAPDGTYDFHSTSGDVVLHFPKAPSASFDVSSFSGDIDSNFGPRPQRTSEYGPGKEWHYRSGSGKAQISINTMSGDIRLHAAHH